MNDLLGNLQEIRQLVERYEIAENESQKTLKMHATKKQRDFFAALAMEKLLVFPIDSACVADQSYKIADAMMRRREVEPHSSKVESCDGKSETAWHLGPPPARDDGKMILVMLSPQSYDEGGGGERWAFVVRCYAKGVSTINGSEWSYPSVAAWCEIPK